MPMIEVREELNSWEIEDKSWGEAKKTFELVHERGIDLDDFIEMVGMCFEDYTPTMTELNDYIGYDCLDWILNNSSFEDYDDLVQILNYHGVEFDEDELSKLNLDEYNYVGEVLNELGLV